MTKNNKKNLENNTNNRLTLGFLLEGLFDAYQTSIWNGVVDAAQDYDVNLLCFIGEGGMNSPFGYSAKRNDLFELVNQNIVDGIIGSSATFSNIPVGVNLDKFYKRLSPMPIISIGIPIDGIPSILVDNEQGMTEIVEHLIIEHNCKKIAFIQGTAGHPEAELRFEAYKRVLEKNNIQFNPSLVFPGDFGGDSGAVAVDALINSAKMKCDAIVGVDDYTALKALKALQKHGVRVPEDIAVAGFDDYELSRNSTPSLTTAHQPLYRMGYLAVEKLLEVLRGNTIESRMILPTKLVVRRSCGCLIHRMQDFQITIETGSGPCTASIDEFSKKNYPGLLTIVTEKLVGLSRDREREQITNDLIEAFITGYKSKDENVFVIALEKVVHKMVKNVTNINLWLKVVYELLNRAALFFCSKDDGNYINNVWKYSQEFIADYSIKKEACEKIRTNEISGELHSISLALISSQDIDEIKNVIINYLPIFGINSCFVSLFLNDDDIDKPVAKKKVKLLIDYQARENITLVNKDHVYESGRLIPGNIKRTKSRSDFMTMALCTKDEEIGFIVFEIGTDVGIVYEKLAVQISSAIKAAKLIEKITHNSIELQTVVEKQTGDLQVANKRLKKEIDERKKTEEALFKEKELALVTLKSIGDPVIITNLNDIITYSNPVADNLLGYEHTEILGLDIKKAFEMDWSENPELSHIDFHNTKSIAEDLILHIKSTITDLEMSLKTRTGKIIPISLSASLISTKEGMPHGIIYIARDITERKEAEEQTKIQQQQLMQADKMASLGILVSSMAHEINNPNNFIMLTIPILEKIFNGMVPILERYYSEIGNSLIGGLEFDQLKEKVPQLISGITIGAKRIQNIVDELKSFARQDSSNMSEVVDVRNVIKSATTLLSNLIQKSTVNFSVDHDKDLPSILGNYQRLEQVVVNLLENSCQALKDINNSITITTKFDKRKNSVIIRVIDEGMGIEQDTLKHIFDPFFSTKREKGGTGLGLSISSQIIEQHRGKLEFISKPGGGTTAMITLPIKPKE